MLLLVNLKINRTVMTDQYTKGNKTKLIYLYNIKQDYLHLVAQNHTRMSRNAFYRGFVRFGNRLIQTICLCTILFILILMANDQIRLANISQRNKCYDRRNIMLSILAARNKSVSEESNKKQNDLANIQEKHDIINNLQLLNSSSRMNFEKYRRWIPNPRQKSVTLLDNPYVIKNSDACQRTHHSGYIVLIFSASANFEQRQSIRNTWGNKTVLRERDMSVVFLLGLNTHPDTQMKIVEENERFHDIVQGNFIDSYSNLTHKMIFGFRWVRDFCADDKKVLKVDDDVFLDTDKLFTDYSSKLVSHPNSILCVQKLENTSPIQRAVGKWKVDENEFRNLTTYPVKYCLGFFMMMPQRIASMLYEVAQNVPFFWIDDVYVGMLTEAVGIDKNVIDIGANLSLHTYNSLGCYEKTNRKCNLLAGNAPSKQFMELMWRKMIKHKSDTSNVTITG